MSRGYSTLLLNVITTDQLPADCSRTTRQGHVGAMTAAERALLNALQPRLTDLLLGHGVTVQWVAERTQLGSRQIVAFLTELGAKRSSNASRWRIPNLHRVSRFNG